MLYKEIMQAFFRADASNQIGHGHVVRCLNLAEELQKHGDVYFFSRNMPEPLLHKMAQLSVISCQLPDDIGYLEEPNFIKGFAEENNLSPDVIIVDHYQLGIEWEKAVKPITNKLVAIDDVAGEHFCDVIIDQNYIENFETRYDGKVPDDCVKLLGPKYVMLGRQFRELKEKSPATLISSPCLRGEVRRGALQNILVCMGGSDSTNSTGKIVEVLKQISDNHSSLITNDTKVIIIGGNIDTNSLPSHWVYHQHTDNMAKLMAEADLSIGAGGSMNWERCYMGLPSIIMSIAENQIEFCESLAKYGTIKYINGNSESRFTDIEKYLNNITPDDLSSMSSKARQLVDGRGVKRLAEALSGL